MELKETADKFLSALGCQTFSEFPDRIMRDVMDGEIKVYEEYLKLCPDLTVDWMQRIYQFYLADREEKKQDFTPVSLAKLVAKLTEHKGEKIVYDCCAGSGALTIQKWNTSHNLKFVCEELDENVVPLLLFNLAVRNINATVINGDVLSEQTSKVYQVQPGENYGTVTEIKNQPITADSGISNPPYNIRWQHPVLGELDPRFTDSGLPPESNANYAFVLNILSKLKRRGRAAVILPCGVLTSGPEKQIREYLIRSGKLESVINLSERMFESTSIPVCVLTLTQNKNEKVELIDARGIASEEIREQRGGLTNDDVTHRARIYKKEVNVLSDEAIQQIVDAVHKKTDKIDFSIAVKANDVADQDYVLSPQRYIKMSDQESEHRPIKEIVKDINRIVKERNTVKLTVNETLAKKFGIGEIYELMKERNGITDEQNKQLAFLGIHFEKDDYLHFSKNKNEIKFENKSKEKIADMFPIIFMMYIQMIHYFNNMENEYTAELRDTLLPELMSGRIRMPAEEGDKS